jgi:acetate kinase
MSTPRVLTLNGGSSTLKFSIYQIGATEELLLCGKLDRIGSEKGRFLVTGQNDESLADESVSLPDQQSALRLLLDRLPSFKVGSFDAIGYRVVQGGPRHLSPELVTPALLDELRAITSLDPPHLTPLLKTLETVQALGRQIPQVACFDTSFHRSLPPVAQALPLPRRFTEGTGLMRYGFHGLSYEYIVSELVRVAGRPAAEGKVIIAHLGNGASMAAVRAGKSVETTMGFTPAGGLVMSSRTGDLDPGVLAYLLRERKVAPDQLNQLIFQQSGLKGVSEISSDMRDLLQVRAQDSRAQEAIDLFCYQARKTLGSLVAVLDGVETLVFTGGIGENIPLVRAAIGEGQRHLGLLIDSDLNERNQEIISSPKSTVVVRVMKTNEELVIARHTTRLVFSAKPKAGS